MNSSLDVAVFFLFIYRVFNDLTRTDNVILYLR